MSKTTTYKASKAATSVLSEAVRDEVLFTPSKTQRRAKACFWVAWQDNPSVDIELITAQEAVHLSNSPAVNSWWSSPGFKEWFLNRDEHRQRLEYLYDLALDAAEEILLSTDPKTQSARVNVIKAVAELGSKFPKGQNISGEVQNWLSAIGKMDSLQLKALFEKQGAKAGLFLEKTDPKQLEE